MDLTGSGDRAKKAHIAPTAKKSRQTVMMKINGVEVQSQASSTMKVFVNQVQKEHDDLDKHDGAMSEMLLVSEKRDQQSQLSQRRESQQSQMTVRVNSRGNKTEIGLYDEMMDDVHELAQSQGVPGDNTTEDP